MGQVEAFFRLFRGRGDAHGSWTGGCIREPLTPELFQRHLMSHDPKDWIGVYNVLGTRCSWGCVDIDVADYPLAHKVRMSLLAWDIPAWIEQTTRGFHVWVFPADVLIPATTMRRALMGACLAVGYNPKEVFPKQVETVGAQLGNYVRLPLNGGFANPAPADCRRFVHGGVTLADMDQQRATTPNLDVLAARVTLPQPVDIPVDNQAGLEVQWEVERVGGPVLRVWRDGPMYGHDRSTTLAQLAHRCREADLDPNMALAIVRSGDERWGKFSTRAEGGLPHLIKIVQQAYAQQASA